MMRGQADATERLTSLCHHRLRVPSPFSQLLQLNNTTANRWQEGKPMPQSASQASTTTVYRSRSHLASRQKRLEEYSLGQACLDSNHQLTLPLSLGQYLLGTQNHEATAVAVMSRKITDPSHSSTFILPKSLEAFSSGG